MDVLFVLVGAAWAAPIAYHVVQYPSTSCTLLLGGRDGGAARQWGDTLEYLDMSGNALADRGALALASALWRVTKLTTLWLADAQIGPEGALAIAEALPTAPGPIGRLYVNGNAIGANAAVRFLAEEEKTSTYVYQRDLVEGGGAAPDEPMPPEKLSFDLVAAARSGGGAQAAPRVRMEDLELSELKDEP